MYVDHLAWPLVVGALLGKQRINIYNNIFIICSKIVFPNTSSLYSKLNGWGVPVRIKAGGLWLAHKYNISQPLS
jgi:hypothetical protein